MCRTTLSLCGTVPLFVASRSRRREAHSPDFQKRANRTEYGAIGVIIYSDPHEDGDLAHATPYPKGLGRHLSAVQRGTVLFLSKLPGAPSTPGHASKPSVRRADSKKYIPSIPSLPISFRDALPLFKSLNRGDLFHQVLFLLSLDFHIQCRRPNTRHTYGRDCPRK